MNLPPIVGRIVGDLSDFSDSLRGASGQAQTMSQRVGGAMTVAGTAALGAGAALTAMAEESQQASAQARIAVENTGASYKDFEGKVGALGDKMIKLGHDDEEATRAFATLATATQDPQKALDSMGLVADIAAARHISLEAAADKLAKGMNGNAKVFKEFGITLKANATEEERAAAITELTSRVQGQAAAQADTFGNKVHVLKEKFLNMGEELGTKFGPAIMIAGGAIGGIGQIIQSGLIPKLIAGASSAYAFAAGMVASAYSAVAAAMPIIIAWAPVILTVAAIGVAAYLLYRNWDTVFGFIKNIAETVAGAVVGAFEWIKTAIATAVTWVGDKISDIVGFFLGLPGRAWDAVKGLADKLWDAGTTALGKLKDAVTTGISDAVGFIKELPGKALDALGNLGSILFDAGKKLIGGFIDGIKNMFTTVKNTLGDLADKLTSWKGPPAKDARLLYGAGQLVMEGFVGGLESRYGQVRSALGHVSSMVQGTDFGGASAGSLSAGPMSATPLSGTTGGGLSITVIVNVPNGFVGSEEQLAKALVPAFRDEMIRSDDVLRRVVYGR